MQHVERQLEGRSAIVRNGLAFIGGLFLLKKFYQSWKNYSIEVLNFGQHDLVKRYYDKEKQSHALISDVSNEYGKEFAKQLARKNFDLILMAPSNQHFDQLLKDLKQINPKISITTMITNFKQGNYILTQPEYNFMLKAIDIAIVVNTNLIYPQHGKLVDLPDQKLIEGINANVYSGISLVKYVLPNMLKRNKKSIIVELANSQANNPQIGYSIYAASISFGYSFIQALANELWSDQIDLLVLRPSFEGEVTAQDFVAQSIKKFGNTLISYGHPLYYFQSLLSPPQIE